MSYVDTAYKGISALDNRKWDQAIDLLSKALASSPNPAWLIARSKALTGANRFDEALADSELAWHEAARRSKRELIIEAQHRRGVVYNRLGELANADCCCLFAIEMLMGGKSESKDDLAGHFKDDKGFWTLTEAQAQQQAADWDAELSPQEKGEASALKEASGTQKFLRRITFLRQQVLRKMDALPQDDPARKCTATQKPPVRELAKLGAEESSKTEKPAKKAKSSPEEAAPIAAVPSAPKSNKIRLQEIQSSSHMSVSVFSKGNDKSKMSVKFTPFGVIINPAVYPDGQQSEYKLATWGEIVPDECSYTVTPSKIELKLKKATTSKWAAVEYQGDVEEGLKRNTESSIKQPADTNSNEAATATKEEPKNANNAGPSYPTSSKGGHKNWDNLDIDSDEDESDVNGFFKKLYKGATPEQQRAMMKSFTESSGTSLSTDWNDVKDRTVDAVPPEGVEAKKWEK